MDKRTLFCRLCGTPLARPVFDLKVLEKYDDYKYPFSKYGLGLIDAPSHYNNVSNYFLQPQRLNCSSYSFKSPIDVWNNGTAKQIWSCLGPIWRGINEMKKVNIFPFDRFSNLF